MNSYNKKLEFLDWEFGAFFHFGIRAFFPGHEDWDGKEMPMEAFDPKELDCEQWIKTVKAAGATYAILTCKHHDGFSLWPTKYSQYSVAGTPWKDGKGDVVKEFVDACRKEELKVGLYYSPAQWGKYAISFENGKEYDDYFINQVGELLCNYGKIDYLWFDGCGSENHEFDMERITAAIAEFSPDILTFCSPKWAQGIRWVGNEDGYASLDNPLTVSITDFSERATECEMLDEEIFLPSECDCKLRHTWFYDNNEDTIKSVDELFGMYESSVGRGSNFLLNIGPDNRGLLNDADVKAVLMLGEKIKASYGAPVDFTDYEKEGNTYTIVNKNADLPEWKIPEEKYLVNAVAIREDLTDGQKINSFSVYAYLPRYKKKKVLVFRGATVGHKVICKFPAIRASKIEVVIEDASTDVKLRDIKAYFSK